MEMDTPTTTVSVYDTGNYHGEMPGDKLDEVIKWFCEKRELIPVAYRDVAEVDFSADEYSASIRITYERPETDEEREAREKQEKYWDDRRRIDELDTLRRLKAKYESV